MSKKAIIALSGGVDSAVAAYLLKKQGYEIIAIFMQNWDDYLNNSSYNQPTVCSQSQDWNDAQAVANQLNIPLYKINFIQEYWEKVFAEFLQDLKQGLTPNPDVLCNSSIKFLALVEYAQKHFTPDLIATGHYAKISFNDDKKQHYLNKPHDSAKDQTYFLCQINLNILNKLIFPLADLTKREVRRIAEEIKLISAQKKDSTGICFIGKRNFNQFLANYLPPKAGDLIDINTKEIKGQHSGNYYFTIGQRHGIGLSSKKQPYYVVGKEVKKNVVYIAQGWENSWLYSNYCWVKNVNWLVKKDELANYWNSSSLTAKFRYRQPEVSVKIFPLANSEGKWRVQFGEQQRAITPGQYAVFYSQNVCLGGGAIEATEKLDFHSQPINL